MSPATAPPVLPDPAAPRRDLRDLAPWGFVLLGTLLGLAAGRAALPVSEVLQVDLSPLHGVAIVVAVLAAVPILRRPAIGLVVLVLVVYLNLSDVLIRQHGLPSLLHLLLPLLLAAAWLEGCTDALRRIGPRALVLALAAYVLVFVVSSVVATEPHLADARSAEAAKGFALFLLLLLLASTPARVRVAVWALVAGGLVLSAISLVQVTTAAYHVDVGGLARVDYGQIHGDVRSARVAGPIGDPNYYGQILVFVVPLALLLAFKESRIWLRLLALCAAAAAATTVVFTYSRGGALAMAIVLLLALFAAHPSRRRLSLGAALLLAGLLLLPGAFAQRMANLGEFASGEVQVLRMDTSVQNRLLWARVAWRQFLDHPLLGVGAGNYTVHYYDYADQVGSVAPEYDKAGGAHYPHSLYLELAAETGLLGLLAFGAVVLLTFGCLHRAEAAYFAAGEPLLAALASALAIALLGFLVSSLFLHGHYQRYLWILLGLCAALAARAPQEGASAGRGGGAA